MWANKTPLFGNKPVHTQLSDTTKSAMEKVGPVSKARASGFELSSSERGGMQYVPSMQTSIATAKFTIGERPSH